VHHDADLVLPQRFSGLSVASTAFRRQTAHSASNRGAPPKPPEGAETQPDLFTAIQQQLGLKLESTRAQTDVLVIDKVEKPSEN
jgi:uncharacterized protein (TIGR03435 family)